MGVELGGQWAIVTSQLGLDARLEAALGLGHELGAHVVPRRVVGRRDGDRGVREVADLAARAREKKVRGLCGLCGVGAGGAHLRLDLLLDLRGEEKNG